MIFGADLRPAVEQLREKYEHKSKIGKLDLLFNKSLEAALNAVTINGVKPQSTSDCDLVLHLLEMENLRNQCAGYWNDLMAKRTELPICSFKPYMQNMRHNTNEMNI